MLQLLRIHLTIDGRGIALEIGAPGEATEIVGAVFGKAS